MRPLHASLLCALAGCAASGTHALVLDQAAGVHAKLVDSGGEVVAGVPVKMVLDRWPALESSEAGRGSTGQRGELLFGYRVSEGSSFTLGCEESCSLWADVGDGWQLLELVEGCDGEEELVSVELQLEPREFEFRFDVSDVEGRPLEGATLRLVAGQFGAPVDHLPARRTDGAGRLTWKGFVHGDWWVDVSSPGCAPVRTCPYQFIASDDPERRYPVTLRPAQAVTVEVVDPSGRPAVGVRVLYTYENIGLPTFSTWSTLTDEQGESMITLPSGGGFELEVQAEGSYGEREGEVRDGRLQVQMQLR